MSTLIRWKYCGPVMLNTDIVPRAPTTRAPRLNSMVLRKMPSGLYEVTVLVLNAKGDTIARDFKWVRVV